MGTELKPCKQQVPRRDLLKVSALVAQHSVFFFSLCALLLSFCASAQAQQPVKVHRIGFLGGSSASAYAGFVEAFKQELRDLGQVEGKSFVMEHRYGDGKLERLRSLQRS
jgi:hypothetical protein